MVHRLVLQLMIAALFLAISSATGTAYTVDYTHSDPLTGQPGGEASVSTRGRLNKDDGTIMLWFDVKPEWAASRSRRFIFSHDTGQGKPLTETPPFLFANMFALGLSPRSLPAISVWMSDSSGQVAELGVEADLSPGWHHLAVTWCRERRLMRLSVDGSEVMSSFPYWLEKIGSRITIGNWTDPSPENSSGGRIALFRIYKVILEPSEIEEDYRRRRSQFYPAPLVSEDLQENREAGTEESAGPAPSQAPVASAYAGIKKSDFRWYIQREGEPFRVKIPVTWTVEHDDPNFVASFISPGSADFPSEMNISRQEMRSLPLFIPEKDVKTLANSLAKKYSAEVRTSSATVAGYPAVGFELTTSVWGRKYKLVQILFFRRRRTRYLLQGMFLIDNAKEGIASFRTLLESFQFREP